MKVKTMQKFTITQLVDMLSNYIQENDTGKFNVDIKQAKQQLATLKSVLLIYGDTMLSIEKNNKTIINNGSLYESLIKFILINDNDGLYFHSAINKKNVGRYTMQRTSKETAQSLGLKRSANYEIKTSMRNESNDLKDNEKRIIYITYKGAYLLNANDITLLKENDNNFKKGTRRLKANLNIGVKLETLSNILAL